MKQNYYKFSGPAEEASSYINHGLGTGTEVHKIHSPIVPQWLSFKPYLRKFD